MFPRILKELVSWRENKSEQVVRQNVHISQCMQGRVLDEEWIISEQEEEREQRIAGKGEPSGKKMARFHKYKALLGTESFKEC